MRWWHWNFIGFAAAVIWAFIAGFAGLSRYILGIGVGEVVGVATGIAIMWPRPRDAAEPRQT